MEQLYVIHNKSYHEALLQIAIGNNPFARLIMDEAAVIYCPADPRQTKIVQDVGKELYAKNGFLKTEYAGRTTFLY